MWEPACEAIVTEPFREGGGQRGGQHAETGLGLPTGQGQVDRKPVLRAFCPTVAFRKTDKNKNGLRTGTPARGPGGVSPDALLVAQVELVPTPIWSEAKPLRPATVTALSVDPELWLHAPFFIDRFPPPAFPVTLF